MNEQLRQRFCKFFGTPRGCFSGKNCKFLHPEGTGSFPQGSAHSSGGKTFLLLYVIKGHSCILLVWPRLAGCGFWKAISPRYLLCYKEISALFVIFVREYSWWKHHWKHYRKETFKPICFARTGCPTW